MDIYVYICIYIYNNYLYIYIYIYIYKYIYKYIYIYIYIYIWGGGLPAAGLARLRFSELELPAPSDIFLPALLRLRFCAAPAMFKRNTCT